MLCILRQRDPIQSRTVCRGDQKLLWIAKYSRILEPWHSSSKEIALLYTIMKDIITLYCTMIRLSSMNSPSGNAKRDEVGIVVL